MPSPILLSSESSQLRAFRMFLIIQVSSLDLPHCPLQSQNYFVRAPGVNSSPRLDDMNFALNKSEGTDRHPPLHCPGRFLVIVGQDSNDSKSIGHPP